MPEACFRSAEWRPRQLHILLVDDDPAAKA